MKLLLPALILACLLAVHRGARRLSAAWTWTGLIALTTAAGMFILGP